MSEQRGTSCCTWSDGKQNTVIILVSVVFFWECYDNNRFQGFFREIEE